MMALKLGQWLMLVMLVVVIPLTIYVAWDFWTFIRRKRPWRK